MRKEEKKREFEVWTLHEMIKEMHEGYFKQDKKVHKKGNWYS